MLYLLLPLIHCMVVDLHSHRAWKKTIIFLSATIPNAIEFAKWICHLHKWVSCCLLDFVAMNTSKPITLISLAMFE